MIGPDIRIVIVEIRGDKTRIGIEAPSNVAVHRQEIFDLIKSGGIQSKEKESPSRVDATV